MAKIFLVYFSLIGIIVNGQNEPIWCGGCPGAVGAGCCGSSGGVTFSRGKRDIDTNDQEKRMPSCPSDCSCQAYFGECCETIGFYLKYFAYVINFGNIPSHITDAEWRSAFPTFNSRDQLERYFGEFRWPEVQCNTVAGTCP